MYIFPLDDGENRKESNDSELQVENFFNNENFGQQTDGHGENVENELISDEGILESSRKPRRFSVSRVNMLLEKLEGKLLSYKMFARDTKASRNT